MKFQFTMKIAGVSKNDANGNQKIWEGANIDFNCEASVPEMVECFKDKQLGLDKVIQFVKQDLPNSIKDCGSAILEIDKQKRILDNELPHKNRREMEQQIENLKEMVESWRRDWQEEHDQLIDENLNKLAAREQVEKLKKQLEEKERIINSLRADCEGTSESLHDIQNKYDDLRKRIEEKAKVRKEWSETIA